MTALGIDVTDKREVKGWEAVGRKTTGCKPLYLVKAREELEEAWHEYLDLVDFFYDNPQRHGDQSALEDAMERIDELQRKCDLAYKSYEQGLDDVLIPAFEEEL